MPPISFKFGAASSANPTTSLYAGILGEAPKPVSTDHAPIASTSGTVEGLDRTAEHNTKDGNPSTANTAAVVKSAALAFGPVKKRPVAAAKARPTAASFMVASTSAAQATYSAPPQLIDDSAPLTEIVNDQPAAPIGWARKTTRSNVAGGPPPLTLPEGEEDVNGFKSTNAGKKAARKSKKKRKNQQNEDPARDFAAEYDPAKPNDYAEWKIYVQQRKEEAREARRRARHEEEERKRREEEENDSGSYETDTGSESGKSDKEQRPKARFFAPPTSYDEPVAIPLQETGEQAYARRLALSNAAPEQTTPALPPVIADTPAQAKEDAYARALAISNSLAVPEDKEEQMPFPALTSPAPDSIPIPTASTSAPVLPQAVLDAQAKARAIAERLGKLGASAAPPAALKPVTPAFLPVASEKKRAREDDAEGGERPNPQAFAERLMAKYGWEKGKGLGATESGIVNALSVTPSAAHTKQSQQQAGVKGPIGMQGGGRGVIVSETKEARDKEEKARYGAPSRIAVLTNMVGRAEVDDDLAGEIADEARKHGIVENCKIHAMPFNTPEEEAIRIFVFFSGEVGAWKAVREFDGRFFNGRVVRARFYEEWKVTNGREMYGMPWETN